MKVSKKKSLLIMSKSCLFFSIILVACCAAIFGIIYYFEFNNESIPDYDSSSALPEITDVTSVRGPLGAFSYDEDRGLKTQIFGRKWHTTEKSYTTTDGYDERDDLYSSTPNDEQTQLLNQKHVTTENTEKITTTMGTDYEENEYPPTKATQVYETHFFNHKMHYTTTEETENDEYDSNSKTSTEEYETGRASKPSEGHYGWGPTSTGKFEEYDIDSDADTSSYEDDSDDY